MKEREFVEKGSYNHPQADGAVALKQYMFVRRDGKRCLLFRFANESAHAVSGFEILLTQISSDGRVISRSRVPYPAVTVSSGGTYAPDSGVVVSDKCSDFRVSLVYYVSGDYKYVMKRGRAVPHYDPRGYVPPKTRAATPAQIAVRPMLTAMDRAFSLIALLAVAVLVGCCLVSVLTNMGGPSADFGAIYDRIRYFL